MVLDRKICRRFTLEGSGRQTIHRDLAKLCGIDRSRWVGIKIMSGHPKPSFGDRERGTNTKTKRLFISFEMLQIAPIHLAGHGFQWALLRTVACPSRVLKVSGAKSRVAQFHGHDGPLWTSWQDPNFEIWTKYRELPEIPIHPGFGGLSQIWLP